MTKRRTCVGGGVLVIVAASVGFFVGRARAAGIPTTGALTYTGVLEDATGAPLTGSKNIQVQFWDVSTGGTTPQCQTASGAQSLVGGRFQITLPDACTNAVKAKADLWTEVLVEGASLGRTKLGAVPYAVEAQHASGVPIVTPWQMYTPLMTTDSGTTVAAATVTGKYRRVGDSIEAVVRSDFTAAPNTGAAYYRWSPPAGLAIDQSKLLHFAGDRALGAGQVSCGTPNSNSLLVVFSSNATNVQVSANGLWNVTDTKPIAFQFGCYIEFHFTAPVSGWSVTP